MTPISYPDTSLDLSISIPPRNPSAPSGSAFFKTLPNLPGDHRDSLIIEQVLQGNVPSFYRKFKEISTGPLSFFAAPDYLSIGSDEDFIRVVVSAPAAKKIADAIGCSLITSKISDLIFQASDLKLSPQTLPATNEMITTKDVILHHQVIERQRQGKDYTLIDGIKKDIVLHSSLLSTHKKNVAIYGWRYPNGKCIQCPVNSGSHSIFFQDYSQGARLISQKMILDQIEINFYDLLNDPIKHHLVNSELCFYDGRLIYK